MLLVQLEKKLIRIRFFCTALTASYWLHWVRIVQVSRAYWFSKHFSRLQQFQTGAIKLVAALLWQQMHTNMFVYLRELFLKIACCSC